MTDRWQRVVWPGLALAVVVVVLAALGTWQVDRLAWKQALIARVAERMRESARPLPPANAIANAPDAAFEYQHVSLVGLLDQRREFHVFGTVPSKDGVGGPGWFVLSPLTLADGTVVFLNRGFVPDTLKAPETRPLPGDVVPLHATGVLRGRDGGNLFTPAADPARNRYYVRDPAMFAAALALDPAKVYPVTIDLAVGFDPPGGLPKPGMTQVTFPNNHLGYALTWYGLMLTALGVGAVFLRRRWQGTA